MKPDRREPLEPLYKVYERLVDLQRAYRVGVRPKNVNESRHKEALLNQLREDRQAVYKMILKARADVGALQAIYGTVVSLKLRCQGDPIDHAISSLRAALCRYR